MAYAAARPVGLPSAVRFTLGSVVTFRDEYGLVWHATPDVLRVLPIRTGRASVALSLANEIATHLPTCLGGWGVVCEEVVSWPRAYCDILGEIDESHLLKVLEARRSVVRPLSPAPADQRTPSTIHLAA
jgi:hypothetical protein